MSKIPSEPGEAGKWIKREREKRGWSANDLVARSNGISRERGDPTILSQQNLSKFEQGNSKRIPAWVRHTIDALEGGAEETGFDPYLSTGLSDSVVMVRLLPTHVGMGAGGTGDGDEGQVAFSRDLIERELRAKPEHLFAMLALGNSMQPDFQGGDQILVDTSMTALAQPSAFCLWDGDGHVIKYLERIPGSDPPLVRVISANPLYEPRERLAEELRIVGRVVWYGRRVQ